MNNLWKFISNRSFEHDGPGFNLQCVRLIQLGIYSIWEYCLEYHECVLQFLLQVNSIDLLTCNHGNRYKYTVYFVVQCRIIARCFVIRIEITCKLSHFPQFIFSHTQAANERDSLIITLQYKVTASCRK
jgi:hypothetical protein